MGSVLVFYIWTALISVSCLLFFFWTWEAILVFDVFGVILATLYTIWPIIRRRMKETQNA